MVYLMDTFPEAAIQVIDLTKYYNSLPAVHGVNFLVNSSTIFGLLGPNGAGKSTTIKMLTTLLPASSGTAKISGYDINHNPAKVRQHIGYVPQLLSADGELTGYENLLLSAKLYGLPAAARTKNIRHVLDFMGLSEVGDVLVNSYSGGMIRRLEIAQAMLHHPDVLFLDEPTVGLDPAARQTVWARIKELLTEFGTTILMSTHDMEEADKLCDMVAVMHLGNIVAMDAPAKLKASVGPTANLGDVFIHYTGTAIQERGDYKHVSQTRRSIIHRD